MLREAERVRVQSDIDLQPHTTLKKGEMGTIRRTVVDALGVYSIDIQMDTFHKGLVDWNNEAHLVAPELDAIAGLGTITACVGNAAAREGLPISGVRLEEDVRYGELQKVAR